MSEKTRNIHTPLMTCLEKMLDAEFKIYQFHWQATSNGLIEINIPELGLLEHVLSIMGFPEDNSASYESENYNHPDCFCRDWLYEKWSEVTEGVISVEEYIAWAQIEARSFN